MLIPHYVGHVTDFIQLSCTLYFSYNARGCRYWYSNMRVVIFRQKMIELLQLSDDIGGFRGGLLEIQKGHCQPF